MKEKFLIGEADSKRGEAKSKCGEAYECTVELRSTENIELFMRIKSTDGILCCRTLEDELISGWIVAVGGCIIG